jgi:hypothetical protein
MLFVGRAVISAFFVLSFLGFPVEATPQPGYMSLDGFHKSVSIRFQARSEAESSIVWLRLSSSLFLAGFSENEFYAFDASGSSKGTYKVRVASDWVRQLKTAVYNGAMPKVIWETVEAEQKNQLRTLFVNTAHAGSDLDSLDGPSRAYEGLGFSIVGNRNSREYLHGLYSTGMTAGLIALMIARPWPMSLPHMTVLLMFTSGIPISAFFYLAIKYPHFFTDDRWNPFGRYSPGVIGFGLTIAPTLCHQLLRLIP